MLLFEAAPDAKNSFLGWWVQEIIVDLRQKPGNKDLRRSIDDRWWKLSTRRQLVKDLP